MYNLVIASQHGSYTVEFGGVELQNADSRFYLVDKFFEDKIAFPRNRTIYIEAVEENKNLLQAESCLVELSNFGMRKSDSLVVVGGGCVQDIGTIVASLFMRGVKWIYVPTTLAAMGDSCLGGKSSINAGTVKNLVGNFYPPSQVLVDTRFVQSLPPLEQVAGISEIVKICFARSMTNFLWARRILDNLELFENRVLSDELVHLSLISKRYFIEEDEHDTGVRKLLNFGHSFGHAIETASGYRIPHGVAVMVGMIAAIEHPKAIRTVSTDQLKVLCLKFLSSVSEEIRYPLRNLDFEKFSEAIKRDKKNTKNALVLVLPTDIGLALEYSNFDEGAVNIATRATESACKEILNEIC